MAPRPLRTWMLITGVVLVVLQGLLVLAWWMLPRWMPEQVIAYAPWPEPALRAARQIGGDSRQIRERLTDFGPAIGPELLRQYGKSDLEGRQLMLLLAHELTGREGISDAGGHEPPSGFTAADVAELREQLSEMARLALTEGSMALGEPAAFLAFALRDRRLTPLMCNLVHGMKTPIGPEAVNVVVALKLLRDPRAVETLIPLLPIRHRAHPDVEEALFHCQDETTFPQILAALQHEHPVIRTWAAQQLQRYVPLRPARAIQDYSQSSIANPIIAVVVAARWAIAGATLLEINQHEDDLFAQLAQLQACGDISFHAAGPYLRDLTAHSDGRIRGVAIIALGELGNAAEFPVLLELLRDGDADIARKARIALGNLPLTPEQQKQVDVLWAGEQSP